MKKIEANSLEEAYDIACREFGCSIRELKYEIIQYPKKGVLGMFAKKAIIVATLQVPSKPSIEDKKDEFVEPKEEIKEPDVVETKDEINFDKKFDTKVDEDTPKNDINSSTLAPNEILDNFFDENGIESTPQTYKNLSDQDLAQEIEDKLKELLEKSCFDIDTVEVDVKDNTAYIFIDGEDAALLIGKEGYRYNAFSYLLFNWLNKSYGLYIKLEIAEFISTQESMIRNYIKPVVEHVYTHGWGKTKPLDGILVQIALEQLREEFPNKYVAIKKQKDGSRYIIINEFNKRV